MRQQRIAQQIFRFRSFSPLALLLVMAFLVLCVGCQSQIGDACEADDDCPSGSICDLSVENGFCTITDCRVDDCPSESICVDFSRHSRFCMRSCESDDDCREDHRCLEDEDEGVQYCFVDE